MRWKRFLYTSQTLPEVSQGNPLFTGDTPRCKTIEELWEVATPTRFAQYVNRGSSVSFIDHFYDKLLHIPVGEITNSYLKEKAHEGLQVLVKFLLEFGRTGTVDEEYLKALVNERIP